MDDIDSKIDFLKIELGLDVLFTIIFNLTSLARRIRKKKIAL